jgi:riboflavin kinase/FMN adenylyltransferase
MQLIRGIHNIRPEHFGCVLTIGNFDGVHLGHSRVIDALVKAAKKLNLPATVMVFEPQPQEVFAPQSAPARLTRLRDKYALLRQLGVERIICINFNKKFASFEAHDFVEQLLVAKLGVKHLIIGDDFCFGKGRKGNFEMLQQAGNEFNFQVSDTKSFKLQDCRISSTEIRQALERNDLASAKQMLGRSYSIFGRVVHGDKLGRTIGFPTANVLLKRCVSPVSGVYVVKIVTSNGVFYGVANIGTRPTVAGIRQQLEVYIFNFNDDLYGQQIEVDLLEKLRDEQKFSSFERLKEQIQQDSEQAKRYVERLGLS